jgi:uncharacterized protein YjeT (DUF2065 family)
MTLSIILGVLGAFILLESLFLIFFPLASKNILKEISKNKKTIKKVGITEFFLGLILLAISYLIKLG